MMGWIIIFVVIGFAAYVRLAPHDVKRWHRQAYPSGLGEIRSDPGFIWRQQLDGDGVDMLRKLDAAAQATPRTTLLAGSVDEGQITYITRSKLFGFPDYNTIGVYQGLIEDGDMRYLEVHSRLRFGRSDLGVNEKRVQHWLSAL